MEFFVRLVKPIAMATVMFVSALYITKSVFAAAALASVPLTLGWVGMMMGPVYGLTGIAFIAAVAWAIVPIDVKAFVSTQASEAATIALSTVEEAKLGAEPQVAGASGAVSAHK